ncbi:hypothetical protein HanIR_Chr17g0873611 [Helianthus annuus]|nr:hypothetical protein HanIR_Chr17g0873611 [Helianthus annuus]
MKMKDTLWVQKIGEGSKHRNKASESKLDEEHSVSENSEQSSGTNEIDQEATRTKEIGELLGFTLNGREDEIRKQVITEQESNLPQ